MVTTFLFALVVGTWSGNWFPSGRAEHRAPEAMEKATITAAGRMLGEGLARMDPSGSEDVLLCLGEIRDRESAEALCRAIGRTNLSVSVITAYRRRDRFDQQQNVIMTTLPVSKASWCRWKRWKENTPPRGYAHVDVPVAPAVTASVYAVHLKSNYGQTSESEKRANRLKRGRAIGQLVDQEKPKRGRYRCPVVIAGDFNADRFSAEFSEESVFRTLSAASFRDCFEGDDAAHRPVTHHPRSKRRSGSALDYVCYRGFKKFGDAVVHSAAGISDHDAVFVRLVPSPERK